ncbi:DUF3883 domain-containing protein [Sinomicrobium sp. M5D2P9]
MNEKVRAYLIEAARQKEKFVFYSNVVKDCGLDIDISTELGRRQLSQVLGKVSEYENKQMPPRPLLSALAIYKFPKGDYHGDGFYRIAEQLGIGKHKDLKADMFGIKEADKCRNFWQQESNFIKFASPYNESRLKNEMKFFNLEELDFLRRWQLRPYNSKDKVHTEAKEFIMNTIWKKSIYLGKEITNQLPDFTMEVKKIWHKLGRKEEAGKKVPAIQFKHYTWVKIGRNINRGKQIFFTFGVDAHPDTEAFVYKLDCQRIRGENLSKLQIELFNSLIPNTSRWNTIAFEDLVNLNWQSLTTICVNFINQNLTYYDAAIDAVYNGLIQPTIFKNKLLKREKPKNGYEKMPESKKEFNGIDVDFHSKAKEQKELGNKGEELVKLSEIEFLKRKKLFSEANRVKIVKDGEGYDVFSYDEFGNEKFIEVKTTTGKEYTPFFLSENEIEFMHLHKKQYCIYRVFNFDVENNFAEFYELSGDIESQLLMKPTQYKVLIKKEV